MFSNSHIKIRGNIGRDPEMNYTPGGKACTKFSVAVSRQDGKGPDGKPIYISTWFNVAAWDQLAEQAAQLKKGQKVQVEGRFILRSYTDKSGAERLSPDINADDITLQLPKVTEEGSSPSSNPNNDPFSENNLPF